jgi:hypothetical protein
MSVDNTVILERLNTLAAQCKDLAHAYRFTELSKDLTAMHDTLKFLELAINDNVIGLSDWPDVAYAFIKATEKNLPTIQTQLTKENNND